MPAQVDVRVLDYELNHVILLEEILNRRNENMAHLCECKLMIRMAAASVIEKFESERNLLLVIVQEGREVLATYRANLQTYVYSFSFERVRREVAQAEIDYGTKLSAVLGFQHQVADIIATVPGRADDPADGFAITAIQGEGHAQLGAVLAAELEAVRAPTRIAVFHRNAASDQNTGTVEKGASAINGRQRRCNG